MAKRIKHTLVTEIHCLVDREDLVQEFLGGRYDPNDKVEIVAIDQNGDKHKLEGPFQMLITQFHRVEQQPVPEASATPTEEATTP